MPNLLTQPSLEQRLLMLREAKGLSLRTLAEKVGLSASFLSQVERDEVSPSIASLEKIARALRVALASLFAQSLPDPLVRAGNREQLEGLKLEEALREHSDLLTQLRAHRQGLSDEG